VAVTTAPAPEPVSPGTVVPPAAPGSSPVQRGPRKARLQIRQVDPWSVMKLGFLLSLALGIVFVVAVALLWSLLDSGGVFDSINKVVADVANDQTDFTVQGSLAFRRVMGVTLVLAVVQVVLITALATLAAFLYNLASGLVGGLDVTLVEES
jgi:ABC-type sugar transport system permease subunit